jgi:predicted DNA-binding transcriptional regulator AlpA
LGADFVLRCSRSFFNCSGKTSDFFTKFPKILPSQKETLATVFIWIDAPKHTHITREHIGAIPKNHKPAPKRKAAIHKRTPRAAPADSVFINAAQLMRRFGGKSHMFLVRLLARDPTFPRPVFIGRLRHWPLAEVEAWERAKISQASATYSGERAEQVTEPVTA